MTQPQPTIRPDATIIPDKASVWVALESDVTDITSMIPTDPTANFATTGWQFCGLIDDKKGIPLDPAIEVRPYDAFGHPQFRVKLRKGTLKSGFTALETNDVTRTFVLPGSTDKKIGIPKNVHLHLTGRLHQTLPLYSSLGTTGVYVHAEEYDIKGRSA